MCVHNDESTKCYMHFLYARIKVLVDLVFSIIQQFGIVSAIVRSENQIFMCAYNGENSEYYMHFLY